MRDVMDTSNGNKGKSTDLWKPVMLIAVLAALFVLGRVFGIGDRLGELRHWIEGLGAWGPLAFLLLYIVAVVAALPGLAITIAGGALFGSVLGVILVSVGSTIGAGLCFLIARFFARDAIAKWLSSNEKFQKLDRMTEKHGAIMVALTRLVPLFPFNLLNYGFGLTRVPFWTYLFWSWICMFPGTVLYVVGTDAFVKGVEKGEVPWVLIGAVLLAAILLAVLVRQARKKIKGNEEKQEASIS
jgi:uncharacterized membrane protein YdjX (TVP38/TMEM64 family)